MLKPKTANEKQKKDHTFLKELIPILSIVICFAFVVYIIVSIKPSKPKPKKRKCFNVGQKVKSVTGGFTGQVMYIYCSSSTCDLDVKFSLKEPKFDRNFKIIFFRIQNNMRCFELEAIN